MPVLLLSGCQIADGWMRTWKPLRVKESPPPSLHGELEATVLPFPTEGSTRAGIAHSVGYISAKNRRASCLDHPAVASTRRVCRCSAS